MSFSFSDNNFIKIVPYLKKEFMVKQNLDEILKEMSVIQFCEHFSNYLSQTHTVFVFCASLKLNLTGSKSLYPFQLFTCEFTQN